MRIERRGQRQAAWGNLLQCDRVLRAQPWLASTGHDPLVIPSAGARARGQVRNRDLPDRGLSRLLVFPRLPLPLGMTTRLVRTLVLLIALAACTRPSPSATPATAPLR